MHSWTNWEKPAKNEIEKIREIDWSYLSLPQFDKFSIYTMKHKQWPEMEIESTEICLKKCVKSQNQVN